MKVSFIIPLYNAEKTLRTTLDSVLAQTGVDIEVIAVDDCSTDNTYNAAMEIAAADPRVLVLRNESNSGVSVTRNVGMSHATGEYLRFVDGDDTIPAGSTEQMTAVAQRFDSDLVVGIMRGIRLSGAVNFRSTVQLAEQDVIDKYDPAMTHSFSACNKMFRRAVIEEHAISFKPYKHAEDGLFLYEFLQYADMINGCNTIVYEYHRSEFFEEESATVTLNEEKLDGIIQISDRITEMHRDAPASFRDEFNKRILSATLIDQYYRKLWRLEGPAFRRLEDEIADYRRRISDDIWAGISAERPDLLLDRGIMNTEEAVRAALFTVVISDTLSSDAVGRTIRSLYFQKLPLFRIVMDSSCRDSVPEAYRDMINISYIDSSGEHCTVRSGSQGICRGDHAVFTQALLDCSTPYIMFIDDDLQFGYDSLTRAYGIISQETADCISGICFRVKNGKRRTPDIYRYSYSAAHAEASDMTDCSSVNSLEPLLSNRVYRVSALRNAINESTVHTAVSDGTPMLRAMQAVSSVRNRRVRFMINMTDDELISCLLAKTGAEDIISAASLTGTGNEYDCEHPSPKSVTDNILVVTDGDSMSGSVRSLLQRPGFVADVYNRKSEPDRAVRFAKYLQYRIVIFESFEDNITSSDLSPGQRFYFLAKTFCRNQALLEAIAEDISSAYRTDAGSDAVTDTAKTSLNRLISSVLRKH